MDGEVYLNIRNKLGETSIEEWKHIKALIKKIAEILQTIPATRLIFIKTLLQMLIIECVEARLSKEDVKFISDNLYETFLKLKDYNDFRQNETKH